MSRQSVAPKAQCEAEFSVVCIFFATHLIAPKEKNVTIRAKQRAGYTYNSKKRELNALATIPSYADS